MIEENSSWKIKQTSKAKLNNTVLIGGLPGIGNVGKIAIDFIIDNLKAKKIFEFSSYKLPHCVFVNEKNIIELPTIEVFYKNLKNKSLLLLSGDIQPLDEPSCYEFCNKILDLFQENQGKEIIALGGIALDKSPKSPKIYCTGTNHKIIKKYQAGAFNKDIHKMIGPIMGVSGLLTGLAGKRKINAVTLLAETFGHPAYFGVKGAKEILKLLNKRLSLKLDLNKLDDEIGDIEKEIRPSKKRLQKLKKKFNLKENINYIG